VPFIKERLGSNACSDEGLDPRLLSWDGGGGGAAAGAYLSPNAEEL
jgi:hypothetical protein